MNHELALSRVHAATQKVEGGSFWGPEFSNPDIQGWEVEGNTLTGEVQLTACFGKVPRATMTTVTIIFEPGSADIQETRVAYSDTLASLIKAGRTASKNP